MKVDNILGAVSVYCKMERMNPGSSIKDRVAMAMVEEAERAGELKPGISEIIEPTSGNTGIGLAMVAAAKRYPITLVMPEVVSMERKKIILAYGAKIEFTPAGLGMSGSVLRARELLRERPNAWMPRQFENDANWRIHMNTTAQELLADFPGGIDLLITGVGTGGHITGCAKVLKQRFPHIRCYAVEPSSSPVLSGGKPNPHGIQGIGPGFIPKTLDKEILDGAIIVTDEEACDYTARLARQEGILAGISTGASLAAVAKMLPQVADGHTVVTFCYDSGERYLNVPNLFPLGEGAVSFTNGCTTQSAHAASTQVDVNMSTPTVRAVQARRASFTKGKHTAAHAHGVVSVNASVYGPPLAPLPPRGPGGPGLPCPSSACHGQAAVPCFASHAVPISHLPTIYTLATAPGSPEDDEVDASAPDLDPSYYRSLSLPESSSDRMRLTPDGQM